MSNVTSPVLPADTFHVAITYAGAVRDRANGNGYRSLNMAQAELREIKKQSPDSRYTIYRVSVEVVQP